MNAIDTVFWWLAVGGLIVPMLALLLAAGRRAVKRNSTATMPGLPVAATTSMSFRA